MSWKRSTELIADFVAQRDWDQFHHAENLAKSVAIEAGELLECYQWSGDADIEDVRHELADVLIYCLLLARRLDLDVDEVIAQKLELNGLRYPVDRAKGRSAKYDRL